MTEDKSAADELIAALEQEGARDGPGEFTLAPEAARTKMQQFQLREPLQFVLLLVQAASLRGSRRISFEFDADDLRMVFDGQGISSRELEGLHGTLFAPCPDSMAASLQELALACNAAEALSPAFVQVRSTTEQGTFELEICPGLPLTFGPAGPLDWPTRIQVRMWVGRLPHKAVRELLIARCRYASQEIFLDRSRISRGMKLEGTLPQVPIKGPDSKGVAGWSSKGDIRRGELRIVKNGAWITTLSPPFLLPGAIVVIEDNRIRKALSQDAVVQDAALASVLETARAAQGDAHRALIQSKTGEQYNDDPQVRHRTKLLLRRSGPLPRSR
ncbi:MAG: hypothetical protein RBU30_13665 [Polyangia bacterium]|nr:hypothetical protein [Polyangia bacterium]